MTYEFGLKKSSHILSYSAFLFALNMAKVIPYYVVNAFTTNPFGGNPAAVAFVDDELPTETLMKIAVNLNQPITAIVSGRKPSADPKVAKFGIRWFAPVMFEVPLCGHGCLGAAKAVFSKPGLVSDEVELIEFETRTHGLMRARKLEGGWIEISLPSASVQDVSSEESAKLTNMLEMAFGRKLDIKYIGKGGAGMSRFVLYPLCFF